ncbi:MAG: rRNA maturation RNase YbeY [Acidobacteria bacterium]|nr:rRNA maturation RNase YbeY [Acidobacteriota bacterium]
MEVAFIRRRRARGGDGRTLASFMRRLARSARSQADEVTVVFTDDQEMAQLNRRYRGRDRSTDVLSFPGGTGPDGVMCQGEIVISVEKARRQAAQRHHSLDTEICYLLIHGFLHLMGFDHEVDSGEMAGEERRLRRLLLQASGGAGRAAVS